MKKNLYYKTHFQRSKFFKENLLSIFFFLTSWPKLLLEVFVRKNFGERYFSFSQAVLMTVFLFLVPFGINGARSYFGPQLSFAEILIHDLTWYVFLAAFMFFSYQRQRECRRDEDLFDFSKFSLYTGDVHPSFYAFLNRGWSKRDVSIKLEPLFFFLIGAGLAIFAQKVGLLIMYCSVCYSVSYAQEFRHGDNFVLDKIDELISSEELVKSFVDGRPPQETRGFETFERKPANPEFRRKVVDTFFESDEETDEAR